jgi:menaquinol-cytochrome c reductase iron-sulfur subunit
VHAFSTVCPHLGCGVDFNADKRAFACPCHESAFALDGRVESGPSPRGLDRLEARVVEGRVEVKYQRFRQGTQDKVPA